MVSDRSAAWIWVWSVGFMAKETKEREAKETREREAKETKERGKRDKRERQKRQKRAGVTRHT